MFPEVPGGITELHLVYVKRSSFLTGWW